MSTLAEVHILDWTKRDEEPQLDQLGVTQFMVKSIDKEKRTIDFVASTNDIDRYGEIVLPEAYKKSAPIFLATNPVFLAGHEHKGWSGEPTVIGSWQRLEITSTSLEGTAQFAEGDELAERYWNLYMQKHMRAVSVGFIPIKFEMREMEIDGTMRRVRVFTEVTLLEISAVAIPANPHALAKRLGGSTSAFDNSAVQKAIDDSLAKHFKAHEKHVQTMLKDTITQVLTDLDGPLPVAVQEILTALDVQLGTQSKDKDHGPGDDTPEPSISADLEAALKELRDA